MQTTIRKEIYQKCIAVYLSSEKKTAADNRPENRVLADTQGFLEAGGIVNFVIEDNKVRFNINLTASEKSGLKIRSQLLRLAKKVIKDGAEVTGLSETARKEAK